MPADFLCLDWNGRRRMPRQHDTVPPVQLVRKHGHRHSDIVSSNPGSRPATSFNVQETRSHGCLSSRQPVRAPYIRNLSQIKLTLTRVVAASIIRFATLANLSSVADNSDNATSMLFEPKSLHDANMKTERYTITSGATVAEIFIAIFGASVVHLGPVYRQLRYGDPRGRSNQSKKAESSGVSQEKDSQRVGEISVRTRDSFEQLKNDGGIETTATDGGHHTVVPMRGVTVEHGLDWGENGRPAC